MSATALPIDGSYAAVSPSRDRRAALALSFVDAIGPVTYRAWSIRDGGADIAFARRVGADARARALGAADAALAGAVRRGVELALVGDAQYPASLLELPDPPPALWCLGDRTLTAAERTRVALVGTRVATAYGARTAAKLAAVLAQAGAVVVSGMARGIDGVAHAAALEVGGGTIAVLGSGADVAYPRSHTTLHDAIARHGLVVSELPPGSAPTPGAFPRRNRIIAALSRATVVIEAGVRSGALITAGVALDLGRDVAAVPGPIDSPESAGGNALLRDGAAVIADPADVLALAGIAAPHRASGRESELPNGIDDDARTVWSALGGSAVDMDTLAALVPLPIDRCLAAVTSLELSGHIDIDASGVLRRC